MGNMLKNQEPFIHLFHTCGSYYAFDVNTNSIIKMGKKNYDLLKLMQKDELQASDDELKPFLERMQHKGFFSSNKVKEILHPATNYLDSYLGTELQLICLQVTQQCNLRCDYCVYSGKYENRSHSKARMSFDTAKKSIDFLIEHSENVERVNIAFYGGEPILEFELLKKCILYTLDAAEGKEVGFNLTTNGTLFTKEIIEFFMEHDVKVMISLDGPKELHNKNRKFAVSGCGSFDQICDNLKLVKENYESFFKNNISFNVVLDGENDFACIDNFFASYDVIKDSMVKASYISENYAKFEMDPKEENDIKTNYEVFKMYLNKLNRMDSQNISKLVQQRYDYIRQELSDARYMTNGLKEQAHPGGPCIPGNLRLFIDVNGTFYPCERVDENSEVMKIGNLEEGFDFEKVKRILNVGQITEDNCKNCWAFNFCTSCAAVADDNGQLSASKKLKKCNIVKYSVERNIKDYCILREHGHSFDNIDFYIAEE